MPDTALKRGIKPLPHDRAAQELRAARYEPLETYPGKTVDLWRVRCLGCAKTSQIRLNNVRQGFARCPDCKKNEITADAEGARAQELRAARYEPLEAYPGKTVDLWRVRCLGCTRTSQIRLADVRHGFARCPNCKKEEAAVKALRAADYRPQAPHPASPQGVWRVVCARPDCGGESAITAREARQRIRRSCCEAAAAVKELRAAGYEPRAPYPGRARAAWPARCVTCGQDWKPSLTTIRQRGGCAHMTGEDRRALAFPETGSQLLPPQPGRPAMTPSDEIYEAEAAVRAGDPRFPPELRAPVAAMLKQSAEALCGMSVADDEPALVLARTINRGAEGGTLPD